MANTEYIIQAFPEVRNLSIKGDDAISSLGTPVFSDLMLQDEESDTELYLSTVLFDVSQEKNIVKTALVGREGTVKEYISLGDYAITVRGVLVGKNGRYPIDKHNTLVGLMKVNKELFVHSKLLNLTYQVYNVVVENYSIPQVEGMQSQVPFEINLVSDQPIEFIQDDKTV